MKHTINRYLENNQFLFHISPYKILAGKEIKPHSHDFIELVYIAEGKGFHEFKGTIRPVAESDVFVIEPGLEHAYRVEIDNPPLLVYNLLFDPALLTQELKAMNQYTSFVQFFFLEPFLRRKTQYEYYLQLKSLNKIEVEMLIKQIFAEYKSREIGYQIRVKAKLVDLLIFLSRCYAQREQIQIHLNTNDEQAIGNICNFIENHSSQNWTLKQISQICGMSQSSFVSKFKTHTGQTFIEFRNQARMQKAKKLLKQTKLNVIEIAFDVGFNNFSHFHKTFKKFIGISPKQYRKSPE